METTLPGLLLYGDMIVKLTKDQLLNQIKSQIWVIDYDSGSQYYGYQNEFEKPNDLVDFPVTMPSLVDDLSKQLGEHEIANYQPDVVIINLQHFTVLSSVAFYYSVVFLH